MYPICATEEKAIIRRIGEADDVGDVLRAGAAAAFLVSAEHEGLDLRAAAQVEDADALGGMELVA